MSAITINNISKRFRLPHHKRTTFFQNAVGLVKRQMTYEEFWALKDISFEVEKGETFGIIGRNGSGKSTLLKILAKVLYPDSGSVGINGKVASFLELGVGFQAELTAAENIYIYASVLGMSRRETSAVYDQVLDFAELKKFEDMKLKNFSSGMYTRLAFSTAVNCNPDIMLIDEVLAVGDEAFQKKCMDKINEFKEQGKTIILVSHSLGMVRQLCDMAILVDSGHIMAAGNTEEVASKYLNLMDLRSKEPVNARLTPVSNRSGIKTSDKSVNKRYSLILGTDKEWAVHHYSEPNYFVLSRYEASQTGAIHEMRINCFSAGHVKLAIYSDHQGEPGDLLNSINFDIPVSHGWNRIPFPATLIRVGSNYWLAFYSDVKLSVTKSTSGALLRYRPADYATFTFPDTASSNFSKDPENYDIITAWGKFTR